MISLFACTILVAALLFAENRGSIRLKWILKPLASACFVVLALHNGGLESSFGQLIVAGLIFCMAGDILLIPPAPPAFLAGMGAFAIGHVAYIGAFVAYGVSFSLITVVAALAMGLLLLLILRWLWPHLEAFRYPVATYCLIIGVMVVASLATTTPTSVTPHLPLTIGAVSFAVSDIAVARDQFVHRSFFNRLWGLPLYYGAQLLLAMSIIM